MSRTFRIASLGLLSLLLIIVIGGGVYYVTSISGANRDDCSTPIYLNVGAWKEKRNIHQFYTSGGHTITTVSYDPHIRFKTNQKELLSSKLQELNFWDENGVLSTQSKPREWVSPKNLCIVISPEEQSYNKHFVEGSTVSFQSASTQYMSESDTLKLIVNFNPDYYKNLDTNEQELSYGISYAIMKALFKVSLPPPQHPLNIEEYYSNEIPFLSAFKQDKESTAEPLFLITSLDWNKQ